MLRNERREERGEVKTISSFSASVLCLPVLKPIDRRWISLSLWLLDDTATDRSLSVASCRRQERWFSPPPWVSSTATDRYLSAALLESKRQRYCCVIFYYACLRLSLFWFWSQVLCVCRFDSVSLWLWSTAAEVSFGGSPRIAQVKVLLFPLGLLFWFCLEIKYFVSGFVFDSRLFFRFVDQLWFVWWKFINFHFVCFLLIRFNCFCLCVVRWRDQMTIVMFCGKRHEEGSLNKGLQLLLKLVILSQMKWNEWKISFCYEMNWICG